MFLQSPADLCGKIEKGDEVIQVNHQTVVSQHLYPVPTCRRSLMHLQQMAIANIVAKGEIAHDV